MIRFRRLLVPLAIALATGLALHLAGLICSLLQIPFPVFLQSAYAFSVPAIFPLAIGAVACRAWTARHATAADFWTVLLGGCPPWFHHATSLLGIHAVVGFVLWIVFQSDRINPVSAVLAYLYAANLGIVWSAIRSPNLYRGRFCPNGHPVSPALGGGCHICGAILDEPWIRHPPGLWQLLSLRLSQRRTRRLERQPR